MENLRNRVDVRLVTNEKKLDKLTSKPTYVLPCPTAPKVDEKFVGYCNVFDWAYELVDWDG